MLACKPWKLRFERRSFGFPGRRLARIKYASEISHFWKIEPSGYPISGRFNPLGIQTPEASVFSDILRSNLPGLWRFRFPTMQPSGDPVSGRFNPPGIRFLQNSTFREPPGSLPSGTLRGPKGPHQIGGLRRPLWRAPRKYQGPAARPASEKHELPLFRPLRSCAWSIIYFTG